MTTHVALVGLSAFVLAGGGAPGLAQPRQLTFTPGIDGGPAWAPSGASIVFASVRLGSNGIDLWIIPSTGGEAVQLTNATSNEYDAAWSPDGLRIAYYWAAEGDIYIIPASGGSASAFTTDPAGDSDPAWSPDGGAIAFTSNRALHENDSDDDIWVMPFPAAPALQLTSDPADDEDPTWSPDGGTIAFISEREGSPALWSVPAAGGTAVKISPLDAIQPDWSPNGDWIAFVSDYDIYIVSPSGGATIPVTGGSELDYYPAWSPSSSEIVFMRRVGNESDLWVVDVQAVPTRPETWTGVKRRFR